MLAYGVRVTIENRNFSPPFYFNEETDAELIPCRYGLADPTASWTRILGTDYAYLEKRSPL